MEESQQGGEKRRGQQIHRPRPKVKPKQPACTERRGPPAKSTHTRPKAKVKTTTNRPRAATKGKTQKVIWYAL
jgi:hypothetical protein